MVKNLGVKLFNFGEKMSRERALNLNPVVLAFVGDAVYSLFVRENLTFNCDMKTGELNKLAVSQVRASAQAEFLGEIMDTLTEEEIGVYKRARNAKKPTKAKSASIVEYNASTGFEAVLGYLWLIGDIDRLNFLLNKGQVK